MSLTKLSGTLITDNAITTEKLSSNAVANFANTAQIAEISARVDSAFSTANTANTNAGGSIPKITNIQYANSSYTVLDDTNANTSNTNYLVITGTGFSSGAQVLIDTTPATSTTYVNPTTLRTQIPSKSAGTYNLYVVNSDGGTAIKVNGITYSATPSWVTTSPLANLQSGSAFTGSLSATGANTYALASGSSLPSGMTLASNGYYYGTVTVGSDTTYSFTVNAIDAENQDSPATFSISVLTQTFISATGGTVTTIGDYKIHTFTSNGNFEVTSTGFPDNNIEYLVVGGGGAGGGPTNYQAGGGGGGGGFLTGNVSSTVSTYTVEVGAGGTASFTDTNPTLATSGSGRGGKQSKFGNIVAYGGGAGGYGTYMNGYPGASGGGSSGYYGGDGTGGEGNRQNAPNALTTISGSVQGYNGGQGSSPGPNYDHAQGGGGGGAGGAGQAGGSTGGVGRASPISGSSVYYGGGGGGGGSPQKPAGSGGSGGGGNGGNPGSPLGTAGGTNTGGGGGGTYNYAGNNSATGANGGSGIVILKYRYK